MKEIVASHIGREVDKTTKGNICTVESGDECQPAKSGSEPQGFFGPESIAGAPNGNIYVADFGNHRIQELTATGEFVLMFGWDVNKTKVEQAGATQQERNVCAASGDICQAGVPGPEPGQIKPASVAVDPSSGDVYVADIIEISNSGVSGSRVEKFTPEGKLVLELGKEVNETTNGNLCSEEEAGIKCKAPALAEGFIPSEGQGAFKLDAQKHDQLTIDGSGVLYVGDEHRVQEFEADGMFKREISLTSISSASGSGVAAIAVDKTGEVYLVYPEGSVIREFNSTGEQIKEFDVSVSIGGSEGIGFNSAGLLVGGDALYDVGSGQLHLITAFSRPFKSFDIAFNGSDGLYAVAENGEVVAYSSVPVCELVGCGWVGKVLGTS